MASKSKIIEKLVDEYRKKLEEELMSIEDSVVGGDLFSAPAPQPLAMPAPEPLPVFPPPVPETVPEPLPTEPLTIESTPSTLTPVEKSADMKSFLGNLFNPSGAKRTRKNKKKNGTRRKY
jgi:hypothetical protein